MLFALILISSQLETTTAAWLVYKPKHCDIVNPSIKPGHESLMTTIMYFARTKADSGFKFGLKLILPWVYCFTVPPWRE